MPESLDVTVNVGPFANNQPPAVTLNASATQVPKGTAVTFTAQATDPNGDGLAYYWDFGDGSPSTNTHTQTRTWNTDRDVYAHVTVSDMKGGLAAAAVVVRIGNPNTYRINGAVRDVSNNQGVEGVRVTAGGRQALTDSSGGYSLVGIAPGTYNVSAVKAGWTLTPTFTNPITVGSSNASGVDFNASRATYSISGRVISSGAGVGGVTVTAGTYSAVTNGTGNYVISGVPNGLYLLQATSPGQAFEALFQNPVEVKGANLTGKDFRERVFELSGEVTGTIGPHTVSDGTRSTQTSNVNGRWVYTLARVPPGSWNLFATATGQSIVPAFTNPVTVTNANVTGLDFTASSSAPGFLVRGFVDEAGAPLAGVVVSDGTRSSTTDSSGRYVLAGVPPGAHTVTPRKPGYTFTPASSAVTVTAADVNGVDFSVLDPNTPPSVAVPPHVSQNPVTGTSVTLSVLGSDDDGEQNLSYTWRMTLGPTGVAFSRNGSNPAKSTVVTFTKAGTYAFEVTLEDLGGLTATATVNVSVLASPTALTVVCADTTVSGCGENPPAPTVSLGDSVQLLAKLSDQFGADVDFGGLAQWSASGGGTISATGRFTAQEPGDFTVTATAEGKSGTARVRCVVGPVPRIVQPPSATPNPTNGDSTRLSVLADDDEGEPKLLYTWSLSSGPAGVTFAPNGTNAAKSSVATFLKEGTYQLQVELKDERGLSATGFLTVNVTNGLARLEVNPKEATVAPGGTVAFHARGLDFSGAELALRAVTWTASGGSIDANGVFTAPAEEGSYTVIAQTDFEQATATAVVKAEAQPVPPDDAEPKGCGCQSGSGWMASLLPLILLARRRRRPEPGGSAKAPSTGRRASGLRLARREAEVPLGLGVLGLDEQELRGSPRSGLLPRAHEFASSSNRKLGAFPPARSALLREERADPSGIGRNRSASPSCSTSACGVPFIGLTAAALVASACSLPAPTQLESSPPAPATMRQEVGEVQGGYPNDQERMFHVLTNLARHSTKTPNNNECGDYTAQAGPNHKKAPLVWEHSAGVASRFFARHLSEIGCYQHDSCCELGDAGSGAIACISPGACQGSGCNKTCDAGTAGSASYRFGLFGFNTASAQTLSRGQASAYDAWCALMQAADSRAILWGNHTQLGVGAHLGANQTCTGWYWVQAFGNGAVQVPKIPAASAMFSPPKPAHTLAVSFAANYYDPTGKPPLRSQVVVNGHCFDLERAYGYDDNGTYEARFIDPDVLPEGCHPYYFVFVDGDGQRHTYPTQGSLQVAVGQNAACAVTYDPSSQLPADCETGQQQCPSGAQRTCYTADQSTLRHGECRQGYQVCRNGFWSACKDMIGPFPEACDGLDNDCDGQIDEGNPGGDASCEVLFERGPCKAGKMQCISGRLQCVSVTRPQQEVCDGADNDCDGVADDGFGQLGCGKGECTRFVASCENARAQTCTPGTPIAEVPGDFKDNDCDGLVDDEEDCRFPDGGGIGRGRPCSSFPVDLPDGGRRALTAPCRGGVQVCQPDAGWGPCTGEIVPAPEQCDGQDNDCDGEFDELIELGWQRCGTGTCTVYEPACRAGSPSACAPGAPKAETCNGADDNCDGTVDEGCHCREGDERSCYTGRPIATRDAGTCRTGTRRCVDGRYSRCEGEVTPAPTEYCDGRDEDCDGTVDDNCVPLPDAGQDGGAGGGGGTDEDAGTGAGGGGGTEGRKGCGCSAPGAAPLLAVLAAWAVRRRRPR